MLISQMYKMFKIAALAIVLFVNHLKFKKYLKIQIKLHWWLKDNICYKNVPDVSVAITDLLQGK